MSDYRWPDLKGVEAVNTLLSLSPHGQEQAWEIELADSKRLSEFLEAFESDRLDLEGRSALALLILFSITYAHPPISKADLDRVRQAIFNDPEVHGRMKSYWSDGFLDHEATVQDLIA